MVLASDPACRTPGVRNACTNSRGPPAAFSVPGLWPFHHVGGVAMPRLLCSHFGRKRTSLRRPAASMRTMITSILPAHPASPHPYPPDDNIHAIQCPHIHARTIITSIPPAHPVSPHPCPHDDNVHATSTSIVAASMQTTGSFYWSSKSQVQGRN